MATIQRGRETYLRQREQIREAGERLPHERAEEFDQLRRALQTAQDDKARTEREAFERIKCEKEKAQ